MVNPAPTLIVGEIGIRNERCQFVRNLLMTIEIPSKNWPLFCEKINEQPHDSVSIRATEPDGQTRVVADQVPLVKIEFEKQNGACSDLLTISFGLPQERPAQHEVLEPIRLVLRKNAEGNRFNQLEILAENGTTEVHFGPGINPSLLESLTK